MSVDCNDNSRLCASMLFKVYCKLEVLECVTARYQLVPFLGKGRYRFSLEYDHFDPFLSLGNVTDVVMRKWKNISAYAVEKSETC